VKCSFCAYAAPFIEQDAVYVIDGQAVCEDHVDNVTGRGFGPDLLQLQEGS
jgi:hypothetical protein